jgi:hypothetical protein
VNGGHGVQLRTEIVSAPVVDSLCTMVDWKAHHEEVCACVCACVRVL